MPLKLILWNSNLKLYHKVSIMLATCRCFAAFFPRINLYAGPIWQRVGIDAFLSKPVRAGELLCKLEELDHQTAKNRAASHAKRPRL